MSLDFITYKKVGHLTPRFHRQVSDINSCIIHLDSGEPAVGSSQPESISGSNGVMQGGKPADVETAVNPQTSGTHTFQ